MPRGVSADAVYEAQFHIPELGKVSDGGPVLIESEEQDQARAMGTAEDVSGSTGRSNAA